MNDERKALAPAPGWPHDSSAHHFATSSHGIVPFFRASSFRRRATNLANRARNTHRARFLCRIPSRAGGEHGLVRKALVLPRGRGDWHRFRTTSRIWCKWITQQMHGAREGTLQNAGALRALYGTIERIDIR